MVIMKISQATALSLILVVGTTLLVLSSTAGLIVGAEAELKVMFLFGDDWFDIGSTRYNPKAGFSATFFPYGFNFSNDPNGSKVGNGRFADGKILADYIGDRLGIMAPMPYLKPTTGTKRGVNFASVGSGALPDTNWGKAIHLGGQVEQFRTYTKQRKTQFGNSTVFFKNSIALISSGQNDIINYFLKNSTVPQATYVANVAAKIINAVRNIHAISNITKFVVFGTGPVGCYPTVRFSKGESFCHTPANRMSQALVDSLDKQLDLLRKEMNTPLIAITKPFNFFYSAMSDPKSKGFKNGIDVCCSRVVAATKQRLTCGKSIPPINGRKRVRAGPCSGVNGYVWWDDSHTTSNFQRIFAGWAYIGGTDFIKPFNINKIRSDSNKF